MNTRPDARHAAPSVAAGPDPRRPIEVSAGVVDRKHFMGPLGSPSLLFTKILLECRGKSPWWRGGAVNSLAHLEEETGRSPATLRKWLAELRRPCEAAPRGYIRTWALRGGLVILVVDRIYFENGRGRKADTRPFEEPGYRPEASKARRTPSESGRAPRPNPGAHPAQIRAGSSERKVPEDPTGQGVLALGPVCAAPQSQQLPSEKLPSAPPGSLRFASRALRSAPHGAPPAAPAAPEPPDRGRVHALRTLRRVLREYPALTRPAVRQALAGGLAAAAGEARGVGDEALAHGFRCALEAVARYQRDVGRPGAPTLRRSIAALVAGVIPGEAMRYNAQRAEARHRELQHADRGLAREFVARAWRLAEAGLDLAEACTIAARLDSDCSSQIPTLPPPGERPAHDHDHVHRPGSGAG